MSEKYCDVDRTTLIRMGKNPDAKNDFYDVDFQIYATKEWAGIDPESINLDNPDDVQRLSLAMKKAMLSYELPSDVRKFFSTVTGCD